MHTRKLWLVGLISLLLVVASASVSVAGTRLYTGRWLAESFGNDKASPTGTEESHYFQFYPIPQGIFCNYYAPYCPISSTPVTTTGTESAPGANGTAWAPRGPGCTALTAGQLPRPERGGTSPPRTPPLYRNPQHFRGNGNPKTASCWGYQRATTSPTSEYPYPATYYLEPWIPGIAGGNPPLGQGYVNPKRGLVMNGAPVEGTGTATTSAPTGPNFNFPAALTATGGNMRRATIGSFGNVPPYLYSYTYADLRNAAGDFGVGEGFFGPAATLTKLTFTVNGAIGTGSGTVAKMKVTRGANRFGGVMRLLGEYTTKVCFFTNGGCALGYGSWNYQDVGATAYKNFATGSKHITHSYVTSNIQTYYNTGLATLSPFVVVAHRFPWTTGTVTVTATVRGPANTFEVRKGFDNRTAGGIGTVQLVTPILTEWLSQVGADLFETGGIGVMQIQFVPEPGVAVSLIAGMSLLVVLKRYRS